MRGSKLAIHFGHQSPTLESEDGGCIFVCPQQHPHHRLAKTCVDAHALKAVSDTVAKGAV